MSPFLSSGNVLSVLGLRAVAANQLRCRSLVPVACVRATSLAVAIIVLWGSALAAVLPAADPSWTNERGRELFVRDWKPYDDETPAGDGLGPMYNAQSCVECHHQGGVGGGGESEHNVDLLCLIPPQRNIRIDAKRRAKLVEGIGKIHPALVAGQFSALPAITLHKFGENPAYDKWRITLLMLVDYLPAGEVPDRIAFEMAERNTPALFGAGLIDSIPREVLEQAARRQAALTSGVRGKLAPATSGGVGKFGWRGQTASLKQFVMGACANELGLVVPGNDQPIDPLVPDQKSPGLDLDQRKCDMLVAYVASLPPPAERLPETRQEKEQWSEGARLFERVGCAECHVPDLGGIAGIHSDLLLHDMGPTLADRSAANVPGGVPRSPGATPRYYGGSNDVFATMAPESMQQWRTPPLWGVADSAPYLHDGRAPTLDDAILAHAGEGASAKSRYSELTIRRRELLLGYLKRVGHSAPLFD